jgi:hypothetical protein
MNNPLTSIGTEGRDENVSKNYFLKHIALTGFVASVIFVANPARAVSLINGDFETGDLTGWTVFTTTNGDNGSGLPNVTSFNTTGSGASRSARFEVGQVSGSGSPTPAGGGISQNVTLSNGILNLAVDVAAFSPGNNASGGIFTLLLNGAALNTFNTGAVNFNTTTRNNLTASTTVSGGVYSIGIQITRPYGSGTGNTPYQYVDNFAISGSAANSAAVPEPFTVIGSLIGGTAAFRMRKKLKFSSKG